MTHKLKKINYLQDFIINNVPHNINQIELIFGEKVNNIMFNTRLNLNEKQYNNNIIPIINSILSNYFIKNTYPLSIQTISNYYYDKDCYSIKQLYKKQEKQISYYNKKIVDYNLIDNVCLKANYFNFKKPIYFTNLKTYNNKEKFILLEWYCINDIIINVKMYKTYFTFEMKIIINENRKISPNKMKIIQEIYEKMDLIYKNIKNIK